MKTAYDIIIRPVITEQSMEATDQKKYVFIVANDANKIEIKKAVSEIFGVKVEKVTTCVWTARSSVRAVIPRAAPPATRRQSSS